MSPVGEREIHTQRRVVAFFRDALGYAHLGDWRDRAGGANVNDGVVLDLRYEARDIDQHLASPAKVDQWFDLKTRGLTDVARARLKQRWGTMRRVLSARDRLAAIVNDILFDMETRDRLRSGRGNALLVSGSIYSACRLFEMFQETDLAGKCAVVTSYRPAPGDVKGEETGEGLTELRQSTSTAGCWPTTSASRKKRRCPRRSSSSARSSSASWTNRAG